MRGAALALALAAAAGARAEIPEGYTDRTPAELAQAAFAGEYGRLLAAEAGRILRASADAGCLRERAIDPAALETRGAELYVRNGTRMLEIFNNLINAARFEQIMQARMGAGARAEIASLRADPVVRRFIEIGDPARLARLADSIVENIDRTALLARIELHKRLSPLASGDDKLLQASPEEKSLEDQERYVAAQDSPRLRRWLELQDAVGEAFRDATDREALLQMGPRQMMPGVEAELAALCILPRSR